MNEAIFRIFAGDRYVDIQVASRGFPLERLFELVVRYLLEEEGMGRSPRAGLTRMAANQDAEKRLEAALSRRYWIERGVGAWL